MINGHLFFTNLLSYILRIRSTNTMMIQIGILLFSNISVINIFVCKTTKNYTKTKTKYLLIIMYKIILGLTNKQFTDLQEIFSGLFTASYVTTYISLGLLPTRPPPGSACFPLCHIPYRVNRS